MERSVRYVSGQMIAAGSSWPYKEKWRMIRKLAVEFLGTAILVYVACGVATLMFGFKFAGTSVAAGVVATALAFGLTLLALVYFIGPVSGSHVNPAAASRTTASATWEITRTERARCRWGPSPMRAPLS